MVHACLMKDEGAVGGGNKTLKGLSHARGLLARLTALVCSSATWGIVISQHWT